MDEHEQRAILRALDRLGADQRRAAARALLRLEGRGPVPRARALEVVGDLIRAQARTDARRTSDARTDSTRRTLIGARVPREDADRFRQAASRSGQSLYAWVRDALEEHAQDPGSGTDPDRGSGRSPADPARIHDADPEDLPEIRRGS